MTQEEISQATYALRNWLQSQGTKPTEGFAIMCRMMAWCLVDKSTDENDLAKGIDLIHELLEWEVAVLRSNKLHNRQDLAP